MLAAIVAACEGSPQRAHSETAALPSKRPVEVPTQRAPQAKDAPRAARNGALGTGDRPIPQPFTIEQRLLEAVRQGDRATIEKALAHGASIDAQDDLRRSTALLAVLDAKDPQLVQWLHGKGAALDVPDVGGRTPLSYAAADGQLQSVEYLVENGVEVDSRDVRQRTPLFHAALNDRSRVVVYLLERGAAIDVRDRFGDTPLIVACAKGNAATADLLLSRGADPSLQDQEGRTAAERAAPGLAVCQSLPDGA